MTDNTQAINQRATNSTTDDMPVNQPTGKQRQIINPQKEVE